MFDMFTNARLFSIINAVLPPWAGFVQDNIADRARC
jgi:hypothetical protein